jgi:hypothetical protein
MWTRHVLQLTVAMGVILGTATSARTQEVVAAPEGVDVQTRGPVHEAYAEPTSAGTPPASIVVPKQPPPPVPEMPSEMRPEGDNTQWIPGYWSWDPDRNDFIWVSGFWRQPPPGRRWVPGYWMQAANGWQWVPGFWNAADQQDVNYLQSPPAPVEAGPSTPAPDPNDSYVPGTWVPQAGQYLWRPGFWVTPQPGWVWVPAHYVWTPLGYVFVDGYWDYVPDNRGLLFAPVAFTRPLWTTPGWTYRPSYVVQLGGLLSSLFVRPGAYSYYFGDYFGPTYANLGFQPWLNYGRNHYDPLFSYYRWHYRGNPGWSTEMQRVYEGRANGTLPRPPRTFAQQRALTQGNTPGVNSLHMVAPVGEVKNVRLARMAPPQLAAHDAHAHAVRQIAAQRLETERAAPAAQRAPAPGNVAGRLRLAAPAAAPAVHVAPPARPARHPEARAVQPVAPHVQPAAPVHVQPHAPAPVHPGAAPHAAPAPVVHAPSAPHPAAAVHLPPAHAQAAHLSAITQAAHHVAPHPAPPHPAPHPANEKNPKR